LANQAKRSSIQAERAFERAKKSIPGGVNSPVRAFHSVGQLPVFADRASGYTIYDTDGQAYIDYIGSWGPLIFGHADPDVVEAVREWVGRGTSYGVPTELEVKMAEMVCSIVPSIEMVRMVNSGTEAAMSAIRLARAYTGRNKIIKFDGCYHGHVDALLIQAGSGVATLGLPDSPGVPRSLAQQTIILPYNDVDAVQAAFAQYGDDIAAVAVEPIAGNMGVVPPAPGYLQFLREITAANGTVLLFDEVMTGFRVHPAGAQGLYGVTPDVSCFGKVIGGGLPVGAYGGKKEIMQMVAPSGPVYQAGTLSGNPLAMIAGYTTLSKLQQPGVYEALEQKGAFLEREINRLAEKYHLPVTVNRVGSMICPFFTAGPVTDYTSAKKSDLTQFRSYFGHMLDAGILLPPSQFEGYFISMAHDQHALAQTVQAIDYAFEETGKSM
jgi:glutamate-1-semialdehyde 2,1-aminomutase